MKARLPLAPLGVLLALVAGCGSGSGGGGGGSGGTGGAMFVEACNLGCSSGIGGAQVGCSFVNVFRNQEIAVTFSRPVNVLTANSASFKVLDVTSGLSASGTYDTDPSDSRRVIFRPALLFDAGGNPIFGFDDLTAYQVFVNGTSQGDTGPYVSSTGGQANQSRILCQITPDQGISDFVPGSPTARIELRVGGVFRELIPNPDPTVDFSQPIVDLTSPIRFTFDDLMNIATVAIPVTGQAPFIQILVDLDGDLSDQSDQSQIQGIFSQPVWDRVNLTTTTVFTPSNGLPSSGSDPNNPRVLIVRMPGAVRDLASNDLANAGDAPFLTIQVASNPVLLAEDFLNSNNRDARRSGADWGPVETGGQSRLTPGIGGGSGRLGDLIVPPNSTVTLQSGPDNAWGVIPFRANPMSNDEVDLNGLRFRFTTSQSDHTSAPKMVQIRPFLSYTVTELLSIIELSTDLPLDGATYRYETDPASADRIAFIIRSVTTGVAGNSPASGGTTPYTFDAIPDDIAASPFDPLIGEPNPAGGSFLAGGVEGESFAPGDLLDNTDYSMLPGVLPSIQVNDGIFEFHSIQIGSNSVLRIVGPLAPRVYARGEMLVNGSINVSGNDAIVHRSDSPRPGPAGLGGPGAGDGGEGGYRPNNEFSMGATGLLGLPADDGMGFFAAGVVNPQMGALFQGRHGEGVGGTGTNNNGGGGRGVHWPNLLPPATNALAGLETSSGTHDIDPMIECVSAQVGGAAGGGAYGTNGFAGVAMSEVALSDQGNMNTPPNGVGGNNAGAGLTPTVRQLNPDSNNLRGGSGGGGGGANLDLTETDGATGMCIDPGARINLYRSHSSSGGGGGGGGIQNQAGRSLTVNGSIVSNGGDGGSALNTATAMEAFNGRSAAPGGAGSGGAILAQSRSITFPPAAPARLSIVGGAGGTGLDGSVGGAGGTGLVRIEFVDCPQGSMLCLNNPDQFFAPSIAPFSGADPGSSQFLSVGTWTTGQASPSTLSGATSCWLRPNGIFFSLDFSDDDFMAGPTTTGWDMELIFDLGGGMEDLRSYRDKDPTMGNMSFQDVWGDLLGRDLMMGTAAPVVVRFQGAKTTGPLVDPCVADPFGPGAPFTTNSITPWVRHPVELNQFSPKPDVFRFVVLFDRASPNFGMLKGVNRVEVEVTPE